MRIGVTVHFQHSFFSAGSPQTSLSIAETYRIAGHDVFFINTSDTPAIWWDDVKGMSEDWKVVQHGSLTDTADLAIEVGNNLLTVNERASFEKCVWFMRKPMLYHDVEACLYPFEKAERNLDGVSEIWTVKENTTEDDIQYATTLLRKPVKLLPFTWSPSAIEIHRKESSAPVWQQVSQLPDSIGKPWSIHICETNMSSGSSCTIPLLIMREVKKKTNTDLSIIKIHNAEAIQKTEFFRYNILSHIFSDLPDMSGTFIGRQRVIDYVYDPMSIIIAHSRFIHIRSYLLDALWVGIPLVHNSPIIKAMGGLAALGYYTDNQISEGKEAFQRITTENITLDNLIEVRKKILETYSPMSNRIRDAWIQAAKNIEPLAKPRNNFVVGFSDMWDGFNAEYNMFTLMLETSGKPVTVSSDLSSVDLLIFGPFGDTWKGVPESVPKVHYTGENTDPIERVDVKLNIGFKHLTENYFRLPLWMLEINWFRADAERIGNPKPIPIESLNVAPFRERSKFCAFIVSNPKQPIRNAAFQWLSEYKRIDSAGRLFNNMGDKIFAGLGGGGGELKKLEFLKDYKFCLAYENDSSPGYITEKILHAKAAGCIPIYWGDPMAEKDFNMDGCIDARQRTPDQLVKLVKEIDENFELYTQKYNVPLLKDINKVRKTLAECTRRLFAVAGVSADIPESIGFAPETSVPPPENPTNAKLEESVFMTGCNAKFLPSLQIWLGSLQQLKDQIPNVQVIVYLMEDVSKSAEQTLIESFPFTQFRRFPSESPSDFADLWAPEHFAWKIWLMREAARDTALSGKLVFYMDSGAMIVRWPTGWLKAVRDYGICVLEDSREYNKYRCHEQFIKAMAMTSDELAAHQIWAGSMAFVAGHELAVKLMDEAWVWAQKRAVIVGTKWTGQVIDGHYFGHRHDQSILSLLCKRMRVPAYPLDLVYCDVSVRQTFLTGAALYVHRGLFKMHQPVVEGIDEPWIINLDRRADRLEKFKANHPDLAGRLMRLPAFEGTKLPLTPKIARLFAPHDFNWKKPVMGCALSHLALWMQLIHEKPEINNYLILEDDARLSPGWRTAWERAVDEKALPDDWDLIYLGGILPPNREGFEQCVEKVNDSVGRVKENSIFGQSPPNRYFHFCAYAYVLTRRGAQKIVEFMKGRNGYWTSADHMMCNIHQFLNIYFLHPLIAGCYQDDDPVYQNSQFNDFSRTDKFDSDLWNNTERFADEEVAAALDKSADLDILGALEDARGNSEKVIGTILPSEAKKQLISSVVGSSKRIVSFHPTNCRKWLEYDWLKEAFGHDFDVQLAGSEVPHDEPIVFLQRPHVEEARKTLMKWASLGAKFYILHLSDECGTDPIDFYEWSVCLGVIRNYIRDDLQDVSKVRVIPLGYHWHVDGETPRPSFRELTWSFVGTRWQGRDKKLEALKVVVENKCIFMDQWNSPNMLGREENLAILLNSWCVPCPSGQNSETFRLYEALEAGAVPILVKEDTKYIEFLAKWLPLLVAENWQHAAGLIHTLRAKPEVYEQYRTQLLEAWGRMKEDVKGIVKGVFVGV